MKKTVLIIPLCLFTLCGCQSDGKVNETIEYTMHISTVMDETDPYVYAGISDYIFAGTVTKMLGNEEPYSYYSVHTDENIKGALAENIEIRKMVRVSKVANSLKSN